MPKKTPKKHGVVPINVKVVYVIFAVFSKGGNFCDFLSVSQEDKSLPTEKRDKFENYRVSPHKCVPINSIALRTAKTLWSLTVLSAIGLNLNLE